MKTNQHTLLNKRRSLTIAITLMLLLFNALLQFIARSARHQPHQHLRDNVHTLCNTFVVAAALCRSPRHCRSDPELEGGEGGGGVRCEDADNCQLAVGDVGA